MLKIKLLVGLCLIGLTSQASDEKQDHRQLLETVWTTLKALPESTDSGIVRVTTSDEWSQAVSLVDLRFMEQVSMTTEGRAGTYLITSLSAPKCMLVDGKVHFFPIVSHWVGKDGSGKIGNLRLALIQALNDSGKMAVDDAREVRNSIGGAHFPVGFVYRITKIAERSTVATGD